MTIGARGNELHLKFERLELRIKEAHGDLLMYGIDDEGVASHNGQPPNMHARMELIDDELKVVRRAVLGWYMELAKKTYTKEAKV